MKYLLLRTLFIKIKRYTAQWIEEK